MIRLSVLDYREVQAIHEATLRLLNEVGVILTQPAARETLTGVGARVQGDRLLLPPELVERSVGLCPHQVTTCGRDGQVNVLGDGTLHWHNLGGAPWVYEPHTGARRPATVQDVRDAARLLDALDSATSTTPFFAPQDVPGPLMTLSMYRHALSCSGKPLHGPGTHTRLEVCYLLRMAAVVGPPSQVLSVGISPISPLFFPDDVVEAMTEVARAGVPLSPLPCPLAGATAPMSLAGALAQQNAEVLASVVLAQSVWPGLPVIYCGRLAAIEPRTGALPLSGVELGLISAATVQLAHRYGLPANVYGLTTNSHVLDLQNGYERALNALLPALAGADELSGIGDMEGGALGSYAQMAADDEIAASVRRARRGLAVDTEALAVDVIARVMDGSRSFFDQRHTVRALRAGEILIAPLAERHPWEEWERTGRGTLVERAMALAERLLAGHQVPPLADDQERELDEMLAIARRELVGD